MLHGMARLILTILDGAIQFARHAADYDGALGSLQLAWWMLTPGDSGSYWAKLELPLEALPTVDGSRCGLWVNSEGISDLKTLGKALLPLICSFSSSVPRFHQGHKETVTWECDTIKSLLCARLRARCFRHCFSSKSPKKPRKWILL